MAYLLVVWTDDLLNEGYVGPFESELAAEAARDRLRRGGLSVSLEWLEPGRSASVSAVRENLQAAAEIEEAIVASEQPTGGPGK